MASMRCPHCPFDIPSTMKCFGGCGAKLGLVRTQCVAENPPGFICCGQCGAALGTAELPNFQDTVDRARAELHAAVEL